jgi:hypothetical protein
MKSYRIKIEKYLNELETYEKRKDNNSLKPPSPPSIFSLYLKVCFLLFVYF